MQRVYFVRDKISNQIVDVCLSDNLETYKRQFINAYLGVKQKNNFAAIRLWNDCVVYEALIKTIDDDGLFFDEICKAIKVLVLKDFINEFENKKGSVLDKSE